MSGREFDCHGPCKHGRLYSSSYNDPHPMLPLMSKWELRFTKVHSVLQSSAVSYSNFYYPRDVVLPFHLPHRPTEQGTAPRPNPLLLAYHVWPIHLNGAPWIHSPRLRAS